MASKKSQKTGEERKVMVVRFPLSLALVCPECNAPMKYGRLNARTVVTHPENTCKVSGKVFNGPVITLQEVVSNGN